MNRDTRFTASRHMCRYIAIQPHVVSSKVSRYLGRDTIRVSRSHVSRCIDASMHRYTPTCNYFHRQELGNETTRQTRLGRRLGIFGVILCTEKTYNKTYRKSTYCKVSVPVRRTERARCMQPPCLATAPSRRN